MALLSAQLSKVDEIQSRRLAIFDRYMAAVEPLEKRGFSPARTFPSDSRPNAHIFYVFGKDEATRDKIFDGLRAKGIQAMLHYYPLDDSPTAPSSAIPTKGRSRGRARSPSEWCACPFM